MEKFSNILLIQLGDIGDVVLATPTIRAIKETYPKARLSIMVRKPFGSLLVSDPYLYRVVESIKPSGSVFNRIVTYASFALNLRRARYDLVIDLRIGDRGALLSFITGAKLRVGRLGEKNQGWHKLLLNRIILNPYLDPSAHQGADQSLRIVREIGINTSDSYPRLRLSQSDIERVNDLLVSSGLTPASQWITINPFSRWKYKEWDSQKWCEVIDHLWEEYRYPSVLIGSPEEAFASEEFVKGREGRAFNLAGKTTLGELAALISMSSLHLGVDSAAPHIAAALGTPTVTIHGPSDWRAWRTVGQLHKIVVPSMTCVPCSRRGCDDKGVSQCLEQLKVEEVIDVIKKHF